MLQPSNLHLKRRISDRREVTCQRLVTLLQTRAGFQSQDHLPRLEAPCSRTSPKLTTPTLKASTAFLRTTLSPDHRKGPNHQWTLMSTPSKTIQDPERQALRCHFVITHSLTRIASISSTIRNASHLTTATTFKLASTQDKSPHPIDHRSHTARTNTADLGQLGQTPQEKVKEKVSSPTRITSLLVPPRHPFHHQYNPCRGSSIGRACGSYNSKEINLKVVGSSPTFGYSYTTSSSEQLFFCFLVRTASGSVLRRAAKVAEQRGWLRHPCVAFLTLDTQG
jgi:hypothetical protein